MKQTAVEWLCSQIYTIQVELECGNNHLKNKIEQAKEMEKQQQGYSEEDMINFVEFVSKYYSDNSMENSTIYELLKQFKNK